MQLYNTLSRQLEELKPQDTDIFRLYTCGPTVYDYAHIGNFRSYLFSDLIFRIAKQTCGPVKWVMNLTDVDDKTIRGTLEQFGSSATVKDLHDYTTKYIDIFLSELKTLNIDPEQISIIRVSDVIPEIQAFILKLIDLGFAYHSADGVYFSIEKYQEKFGDYGALVGKNFLEGKKIGARVKVDEYEKDNLSDFALWKTHTEADGQIFWEHPTLGKGRPGWHIECSVINEVGFKGQPVDLHTGGVDLVFPHHTNEIAQSQPLHPSFVKYWAHCEHLQVDGKKMAKSAKNFFTLKDLADKDPQDVLAFRYLCLQTDFRKTMNFTWESLEAAKTALHRLYSAVDNLKTSEATPGTSAKAYEDKFRTSLEQDLNIPQALASVWEILSDTEVDSEEKLEFIKKADLVLGLDLLVERKIEIPEEVQTLLLERQKAREAKDFAKSDELRGKISELGFEVKDTDKGQSVTEK